MKLISLNVWCGRAGRKRLMDFFAAHSDADIFCLQEVWQGGDEHASHWGGDIDTKLITHIGETLKGHDAFFRPHYMDWYGLAIFIKKGLIVKEEGDIYVFKNRENAFDEDEALNHARNLQFITIETSHGPRTILNFHGLWNGINKKDSDGRYFQSENIIAFLKSIQNPKILCGDFNLSPETKSLQKIEEAGMKNLIKEYKITSTRSSYYKKSERFADYALISDDIKINDFKILPDEVSDHLAMYLDFK